MRRGEVWTAASGRDYAGKPRPVVIIQGDAFDMIDSVIVCAFTSDSPRAPLFRLPIEPTPENGLLVPCQLMVDKVAAIPKTKLGKQLRVLTVNEMQRLSDAIIVFLGLAAAPGTNKENERDVITRA